MNLGRSECTLCVCAGLGVLIRDLKLCAGCCTMLSGFIEQKEKMSEGEPSVKKSKKDSVTVSVNYLSILCHQKGVHDVMLRWLPM